MAWKFNPFTGRLDYTVDIPAGLPPTGTAGGDLAGTYPNPTVLDASIDHGSIGGLTDDDHPQYVRGGGRTGGQSILGGTGTDQLILSGPGGVIALDSVAAGLTAGQTWLGQLFAFKGGGQSVIISQAHTNVVGDGPLIYFRRARGTTYTGPSAILLGDILGTFGMQGYGATGFFDGGAFEAYATQNWTDSVHGCTVQIYATANGGSAISKVWETLGDLGINCPGPTFLFGTAGVSTQFQVGAGTTGTDTGTFRIRSGTSGTTLAALYLNRGGTDQCFWATDGANTAFAYVGSMVFASGIGGPTRLAVDASGNLTLAAKLVSYSGITTVAWGVPAIHDFQTGVLAADVAVPQNYANAGVAGMYRVSIYLRVTTADAAAGTVNINTLWNDGTAARTVVTSAVMTATNFAQATIYIRLGSGNVQYSITHTGIYGTAAFGVSLMCERLQ